jgi:hypothetical protein
MTICTDNLQLVASSDSSVNAVSGLEMSVSLLLIFGGAIEFRDSVLEIGTNPLADPDLNSRLSHRDLPILCGKIVPH